MSSFGFPDICGFYDMLYGTGGVDLQALTCFQFSIAAGQVFPGNPPFTLTDFIGVYPKFLGIPISLTGLVITAGSAVVTGFTSTTIAGMQVGQIVVNLNSLAKDSIITAVNLTGLTITLSQPALQSDTVMTSYQGPFMPIVVILSYIMFANASVMYNRYFEAWFMMMCYFVAHYCTMYMRSESGVPNLTATQVASSGLAKGIIVSRAAGDVSARSQVLFDIATYAEFGAWTETIYGELFITIAAATASGPVWVK
jgi:hypothetical protein